LLSPKNYSYLWLQIVVYYFELLNNKNTKKLTNIKKINGIYNEAIENG